MRKIALVLGALLMAGALTTTVMAGDVLFYHGHGGLNEGHTGWANIIAAEGGTMDVNSDPSLPSLAGYTLVVISVPGWSDPGAFFSTGEIDALNLFLTDGSHKVVAIGEWDGFYGSGQAVFIDLVNQIGGGTGISFIPGAYDCGCFAYSCSGTLGASPLVAGLSHVCRACTGIFNPGSGGAVAYTVESPANPWVVDNGTNVPCIVGIGDSNTLSDSCGHLTDADTAEFARRLYTITCEGTPVPTQDASWGRVKSLYR